MPVTLTAPAPSTGTASNSAWHSEGVPGWNEVGPAASGSGCSQLCAPGRPVMLSRGALCVRLLLGEVEFLRCRKERNLLRLTGRRSNLYFHELEPWVPSVTFPSVPVSPPAGPEQRSRPEARLHVRAPARPASGCFALGPAAVPGAWGLHGHGHYITSHVGVRLWEGSKGKHLWVLFHRVPLGVLLLFILTGVYFFH